MGRFFFFSFFRLSKVKQKQEVFYTLILREKCVFYLVSKETIYKTLVSTKNGFERKIAMFCLFIYMALVFWGLNMQTFENTFQSVSF